MKCFDVQVNGGFGINFSDPKLTADQFLKAAESILGLGVTRFLPTIVTSSAETYNHNMKLMNSVITAHHLEYAIPGYHLEGPFISKEPGAVGAHSPQYTRLPSADGVQKLYDLSEGRLRILTMAAELPGIREAVDKAHELGIVVSLGHQLATDEQIKAAGGDSLTHLGNGIPNRIDRHRNPIWAGLANDDLMAFIIGDGHHLPNPVLKCFFRCKGIDRVIIISDAATVAGLPPGRYHIWDNVADLDASGLLYNPIKKCLVGSGMFLTQCIDYLRKEELLTPEEIYKATWVNPHKLLKMDDK